MTTYDRTDDAFTPKGHPHRRQKDDDGKYSDDESQITQGVTAATVTKSIKQFAIGLNAN